MIFNSLPFLVFLPIVFGLYWLPIRKSWWQNVVVISASIFFYAYWDWRVLGLFVGSIAFTMFVARRIAKLAEMGGGKKKWLIMAIVVLLSILGVFKYYNFFIDSLSFLPSTSNPHLNLILPLGISFYTFMCISYLVDAYKGVLFQPSTSTFNLNLSTFAYLSFFPQIAAGPIGRGPEMLPQFSQARQFDNSLAVDGCRQFLWGLFKKVVIADGCAGLVARLYIGYNDFSGSMLLLGAFMYAVQIYCDFSGYSDMAIGVGKVLGIRLRKNFDYPYFATNISDFWRRWHMSLTTWFRDYVYIPLGGSRCILPRVILNTWIVFLLSGLWHGAAWTFIAWGALHAALISLFILWKRTGLKLTGVVGWMLTMIGVVLAWVFFRAPSFEVALGYLEQLFSRSLFSLPSQYLSMLPWIVFMLGFEWLQRRHDHALARLTKWRGVNWVIYLVLTVICIAYQQRTGNFIYFQF